jgi:arylformamidase
VPFRRSLGTSFSSGGSFELSSVTTTLHVGSHADAPSHYAADGEPIDRRPLDLYYGPCEVIHVAASRGERLGPLRLPPVRAPRVLLATGTFPDPERFSRDFASLSAELVDLLAGQGVVLVGIDTPSVDPFDDAALEAHAALHRHGMANLEGLLLSHVPGGLYTLAAFPLRIEGGDGSPVRAVLVG